MRSHFRVVLGMVAGIALLMILILGFNVGGEALHKVGVFSPLLGAFIGGILVLVSANIPIRPEENVEPWLRREKTAWTLIGYGCIAWGIGECFWRYYLSQGQSPFPSLADLGYSSLPPLLFWGLILQPSTKRDNRRVFLLLDSLIAMGALLSIAWFLLLGSLAQSPAESVLAKFLGLYYPTTDVALLSCIIFLLLRGQDRLYQTPARRVGLLVAGLGLAIFAVSDFYFNVQQNLGTFVDGSWGDLGWPLGMMTIGMAVYLRRFLPGTAGRVTGEPAEQDTRRLHFGPAQTLPYFLLAFLFFVLAFNVLSSDKGQQDIRPVLLIATLFVTGLVVLRQVVTMLDNERLMRNQATTLQQLEKVYQDIEKRKNILEVGVNHLKEVQTRLANGDVRARAQIMGGDLWPLATGLNLMADRMMRSEYNQRYAQKLAKAVSDFGQALERKRDEGRFVLPASCLDVQEMHSLIRVLGLGSGTSQSAPYPTPPRPMNSPLTFSSETTAPSFPHQPPASSMRERREPGKQRQYIPPKIP